jgi:hypothetical protein
MILGRKPSTHAIAELIGVLRQIRPSNDNNRSEQYEFCNESGHPLPVRLMPFPAVNLDDRIRL